MSDRDILLDLGYDDVIIFDSPSYEGALIGVSWDNQAIYNYNLMVESLIKGGMTAEEAADLSVIILLIVKVVNTLLL